MICLWSVKTANMLVAISLAEKLGIKHNLLIFSLHSGVIWMNLADHLDMNTDFDGLRKRHSQSSRTSAN